jgi:hypothetical protein
MITAIIMNAIFCHQSRRLRGRSVLQILVQLGI